MPLRMSASLRASHTRTLEGSLPRRLRHRRRWRWRDARTSHSRPNSASIRRPRCKCGRGASAAPRTASRGLFWEAFLGMVLGIILASRFGACRNAGCALRGDYRRLITVPDGDATPIAVATPQAVHGLKHDVGFTLQPLNRKPLQ